jgi:hypothetical protein
LEDTDHSVFIDLGVLTAMACQHSASLCRVASKTKRRWDGVWLKRRTKTHKDTADNFLSRMAISG